MNAVYYKALYGNLLYHEYSLEIKLAKQYCFTYLYSVFSCCSMWNPEPFRALLSELKEVEGEGFK